MLPILFNHYEEIAANPPSQLKLTAEENAQQIQNEVSQARTNEQRIEDDLKTKSEQIVNGYTNDINVVKSALATTETKQSTDTAKLIERIDEKVAPVSTKTDYLENKINGEVYPSIELVSSTVNVLGSDLVHVKTKQALAPNETKFDLLKSKVDFEQDARIALSEFFSANAELRLDPDVELSAAMLNANGEGTYSFTFELKFVYKKTIDETDHYYNHLWANIPAIGSANSGLKAAVPTGSFIDTDLDTYDWTTAIDDPDFALGVVTYQVDLPTGAAYTYGSGDSLEYALALRWMSTDNMWFGIDVAAVTFTIDIVA